jgi:hypothetical protein
MSRIFTPKSHLNPYLTINQPIDVSQQNQINNLVKGNIDVWDDERVPANATVEAGSNPPTWALIKNDGLSVPGTATAIQLNSAGRLTITDNYLMNQSFTISFWFKPVVGTTTFSSILNKAGNFELSYWGGSNIAMSIVGFATSSISVNVGSWNHIVFSVLVGGSPNTQARLYINGTLAASINNGGTPADTGNLIFNEDSTTFAIEEFSIYSGIAWGPTEVSTDYNSGAGINKVGDEADLTGLWKFESGSGTTALDSAGVNDGTLTTTENVDFVWVEGHIGSSSLGSRGVYTWYFPANVDSELHFQLQLPHGYKLGSTLKPHLHWFVDESSAGNVRWGLEYLAVRPGQVIGNTVINTSTDLEFGSSSVPYTHSITALGDITGNELYISSMIPMRLFREGSHVEDTHTGNAGLLEFDIHVLKDTEGSTQEYIK